MKKIKTIVAGGLLGMIALTGCASDSDAKVVDENMRVAADNFELNRRIVFLNVEHSKYELEIQGRCSISDDGNQLEVLCRTGDDEYKKHFLGKAQDFTYFAEQLDSAEASEYHYRVIFKPQTIIPAPELKIG